MNESDNPIRELVRAVAAGKVSGASSAESLGMSRTTFWRRIARAEALGVRFTKNARGGRRYHPAPFGLAQTKPWSVRSWGKLKGDTKCPRSKRSPRKTRTS